jgi:hypothetical protein
MTSGGPGYGKIIIEPLDRLHAGSLVSSKSDTGLPVKPLNFSTDQFGAFWLELPRYEIKFKPANVFVTSMDKIAESVEADIGLKAVEIIGDELIAVGYLHRRKPMLAHFRIDESGDVVCTVRTQSQEESNTFRNIIDQRLI